MYRLHYSIAPGIRTSLIGLLWRPLRYLSVLLLAFMAAVSPDVYGQGRRARPTVIVNGREAVDGEVLIRFHSTVGAFEKVRAEAAVEADEVEPVGRGGTRRMRARRLGTHEMLARLSANPDVEFVEPNYIIRLAATPTDPSFGNLWGLFNAGQSSGVAGADIDATLAWDVSTGTRDHVIGIVDTGIDYIHPDLAQNIWTAPSAFSVTVGGVVINCAAGTHGFNAITNTCNPMDDNNHGTHVAGIIGAVGNNGVGVAGVNWTASMMGLKFLASDGSGTTADAIKAIEFAVQAKLALGTAANVRVLSASWGGGYSQALLDEINRANTSDMLLVAAAGNAGVNIDASPTYPAAYSAPNIIAVAATDNRDLRAPFSNYGAATVHLGAPGVAVLSTVRNNGYAAFSGTSVAAPHVSGAAALLLSTCTLTTASLKAALLAAVDPVASMSGMTTTGGRLNVNNAIRVCPPITSTQSGNESVNILSTPSVTPLATSVTPDSTMTFTVVSGLVNVFDWVGLFCPATGGDSAYIDWKYLSNTRTVPIAGLTTATITFVAPAAATTCNARLFASGGMSKLATSATVTVAPLLTVTPTSQSVAASSTMTFVVAGGPANVFDWVGLFCPATGPDGAYLDWKYLSNSRTAPTTGLTLATITFAAPAAATACNARLFANGGSSKLATSATVTVTGASATVTPTSQTAAVSSTMTFAVAGGSGSVADWVGVYCPTSGADGAYLDWKYLSNSRTAPTTGVTAATITFTAPAAAATCNARLFTSGGMSKLATSATVTVTPLATVTPASPTAAASSIMTFTLAGGPGNVFDWVGLFCPATAADGTYIDWKYLSNSRTQPPTGLTAAAITFVAPATATACNVRLFANGGSSKLATSATVTVSSTVTPTVTPASQSVGASSTMTFNVAGGPANVVDWVALFCPATGADGAYVDWKYLTNSRTAPATGLSAATITFAAPAAPGTCNARLFASGGFSKLATSATVTITDNGGTIVLSPEDTSLNINANNYSTNTLLTTYTWPDFKPSNAILMKFDLSAVPANAVVQEAKLYLSLTQSDALPEATYSVAVGRVLNHNPVIALATGYTADGVTGWTANNCCQDGVPLAQADVSSPYDTVDVDKAAGLKAWTVTVLAQEWLADPSSNFGLLLQSDPSKSRDHYRFFASMEDPVSSQRPYLRIVYSLSDDATPPVVSGVTATGVTQNAATINWTTNEAATSQVDYGLTTAYGSVTALDGALVTSHSMTLSALSGGTQYHYRVRSRDQAGNLATSADRTFTTLDSTAPSVSVTAPADGATVSGTISVTATASDNVGVAGVQFTLDGASLGTEDLTSPYSTSWNTSSAANGNHTLTAIARDAAGNITQSAGVTVTVSNDPTPPAVSLTSPAAGATVSGTINATANATDNVAVAGVQFTLDGASLGAEDTSSPYAASWNTTTSADGNHTLTAIARDAAGNVTTSAAITVAVSNAPPPPGAGIAASYPGDVGIENNPNVVFVERFDEASLATLFGRWTDVLNGPGMSITNDAPAASPVGKSLVISFSAASTGGHLYRQLAQSVSDTLYVRYYVKHPAINNYQHSGIWMGGYNPSLAWPNPQAGIKPTGSDRFSASAEQNDWNFDHYNYWMGMHQSSDGNYWGDHLLNNPNVQAPGDQWMCVEQMVKLNTPVTASNGEHAIWINGVKVSHLGQGFPNGTWAGGIFTQDPNGTPFEGFQWRNTTNLNLNWLWLQVYSTSGSGTFKYAHVVAAKSYIGCLASGGGAPDTTLPTIALSAPAAGATVSSTVTVTANASDNVGVAGVQFKLDGVNLGAEDTTSPYSVPWNTTSTSNGSHTLTAVVRDAAGNSSTATNVSVTVSNSGPGPSLWPHEPSGFTVIEETGWESGTLGAWYRIHQSADKPINVGSIADSIIGESKTLQLDYPAGHTGGGGTELRYDIASQDRRNEIYVAYYVQVNPQWQGHDSAINKMVYLHDGGTAFAAMWYEMFGSNSSPLGLYIVNQSGSGPAGMHENVNAVNFTRGQWHQVEIYQKQGASNGVIRVWVDGVLAIDRSDVGTRSNPLDNVTISGIWGGVGDTKTQADYMRFDRIRISRGQ